jgi:competence protein ComEA
VPISRRNKTAAREPDVALARLAALTTRPPTTRTPAPAPGGVPAAANPPLPVGPPAAGAGADLTATSPDVSPSFDAVPWEYDAAGPAVAPGAAAGAGAGEEGPRWLGWLPPGLRAARVVAPRQAVAGLLGVALLAALLTALVMWRARPRATTVGPPAVVSAGRAPAATSVAPGGPPPPASPGSPRVVVSVVGKVRHPGLVTLPAGSRVDDALRAAGGPLPGVDLTSLNLARKLADGEQVVVGAPAGALPAGPAPGGTASGPAGAIPGAPVNLNTATLADLDALPGIGPVLAQRILDWRSEHSGFTSVDQLGEVSGIGDSTLDRLRALVTV